MDDYDIFELFSIMIFLNFFQLLYLNLYKKNLKQITSKST